LVDEMSFVAGDKRFILIKENNIGHMDITTPLKHKIKERGKSKQGNPTNKHSNQKH
jgi:hypothetical protein